MALWTDIAVLMYAGFVAALLLFFVLPAIVVYRKHDSIRLNGSWLLFIMALGAICHIVAEMVSNNHLPALTAVEVQLCVFWGYWLPYVFGAGLFFMALYLRLFTYTTGVSTWFSAKTVARVRSRARALIVLMTAGPVLALTIAATIMDGVVHVSEGQCHSATWIKATVGVWEASSILVLFVSTIAFRASFARDIIGEARKQFFVSVMGSIVAVTQVFVIVVADDGIKNPVNRALSTFAVATLYLWSLGVLAVHPLWRIIVGDANYISLMDASIQETRQPVISVMEVCRTGGDPTAIRFLLADFIAYCAEPSRPRIEWGGGKFSSSPHVLTTAYAMMDAWTRRKLATRGEEPGPDYPPLVANDINREANDILRLYFTSVTLESMSLNMDKAIIATILEKKKTGEPPDMFKNAMWRIIEMLDESFGRKYLTKDLPHRDIIQPQASLDNGVRAMIVHLQRDEAHKKLAAANLPTNIKGARKSPRGFMFNNLRKKRAQANGSDLIATPDESTDPDESIEMDGDPV